MEPVRATAATIRAFVWGTRARRLMALGVAVLVSALAFGILISDPEPRPPRKAEPLLAIAERFPLQAAALRPGSTMATDGDSPGDNTPVWFIGRGLAKRLDLSDTRPRWKDFSVNPGRAATRRVLDIGEWTTGTVAFDMRLERGGVRSRILPLSARGGVVARGFARLARPLVRRDVAVATWSGSLPDLFVIDRLGARERVRITVFSGESGFTAPIATTRASFRKLDPDEWSLDIGRVTGRRPSLIAFSRSGQRSRPEIHVLTGDSGFRRAVVQQAIDRRRYASSPPFVTGLTLGRPSILVREGRRLLTVPVGPVT